IMDREIKRLKRSRIPIIKVRWNSKQGPEFTWEREDQFKQKLTMSSDNAQSAVTYTSISSNLDGPWWGIPLMNVGDLPKMDPYKEVAQQGQVHPLSPTYIPDPMELDEHAPVYVSEPQHPEYHAPSDDDIQGSDETGPFKEDKIAVTPPPSRHRGARISVRPQTPIAASTQALIDTSASGSSPFPLPPISPAYDQAQLGRRATMIYRKDDILVEDMPPQRIFTLIGPPPRCDVAESSTAAAARAPRSQYDFVDIVEAGQGLIRSPGHDTRTIARAANRAEDASNVRALRASERRMMTSIEEVNLRVSYQVQVRRQESENFYTQLLDTQTDRRDIRFEIDVRTAYETELQEVHQAYLSSEARNREQLARLETLETHMSHMEWQRQSAEDLAVTQMVQC
nr:putative reverse transcriptase domain-containing protein [Tanacetum cinerariifolium]